MIWDNLAIMHYCLQLFQARCVTFQAKNNLRSILPTMRSPNLVLKPYVHAANCHLCSSVERNEAQR